MVRAIVQNDEVATGTGTKTLIQLLAGTNHEIKITEISVTFRGIDNLQKPIRVQLVKQTDAGTMSAATEVKVERTNSATLDTSATITATGEPTTSDVLRDWLVHPQGGVIYPVPDPEKFTVPGGERLGLRTINSGGTDTNCCASIEWEE